MKLTMIQREVLELLEQGAIMVVDAMNLTRVDDREVQFQTPTFLTKNRLITRLNKTTAAPTNGNGFILSARGKEVLGVLIQVDVQKGLS